MKARAQILAMTLIVSATGGCSKEARTLGSEQPMSAPRSSHDPRIPYYQDNVYQVSQGGRYFGWYGCGGCHGAGVDGWRNLRDGHWRYGGEFDRVYRSIAQDHDAFRYGEHIPVQQLWQITAYVRDLPKEKPEKLNRQDRDQQGEPTGSVWSGAVR